MLSDGRKYLEKLLDYHTLAHSSEKMVPSDLAAWLNNYLNAMAAITIKWEGTLDKYIGDAVMVFFGDPKTLGAKQDALNCVQMAIEMSVKAEIWVLRYASALILATALLVTAAALNE